MLDHPKKEKTCKERCAMSHQKRQKERLWRTRKESQQQHPHGKVKTFEQLAEEAGKK